MSTELDTCGCDGESADVEVYNAAGLSELEWRVGTWSSFYSRMKAALSTTTIPDGPNEDERPLGALTTRAADDPAIALLDAVSCVLDVLTFYQERIANEGFLGTATEERSVQDLAQMVGYSRAPGVAASAWLAFTVQDSASSPGESTVAAGTQVMSVPGQGEKAQLFEVSDELFCHKDWNTLTPQQSEKHTLTGAAAWADDAEFGTVILVSGTNLRIKVGDRLLFVDQDFKNGTYQSGANPTEPLDGCYTTLVSAVSEDSDLGITALHFSAPIADVLDTTGQDLGSKVRVHVFRSVMPAFGYNAPELWFNTEVSPQAYELNPTDTELLFYDASHSTGVLSARLAGENTDVIPGSYCYAVGQESDDTATVPYPARGAYQLLNAFVETWSAYHVSGKVTTIQVVEDDLDSPPHFTNARLFQAWVASEELTLAEIPISESIPPAGADEDDEKQTVTLDTGVAVTEGRTLLFTDSANTEIVTVTDTTTDGDGRTIVTFSPPLVHTYARDALTIYGNVVAATHGESIAQTLGNGDGAEPNQSFTLTTAPLTHVSASTSTGSASTLVVSVGGVAWARADSFYETAATDEVYTEHLDENGYTSVTFGDGVAGARLPTGTSNVTARWRTGLGVDGNVDAGTLTLLRSRPLGIKGVTNPAAASGGEDAEVLEDMRTNAPLGVLTLDRLVSVSDYAAFANAFAGIGMARADVVRVGLTPTIVVSVLDSEGGKIDVSTSRTYANLVDQIAEAKDASAVVKVVSGTVVTFSVALEVMYEPDTDLTDTDVTAALAAAFTWSERSFRQSVTASEVMAVVQALEGVRMVNVTSLSKYTSDFPPPASSSANRLDASGVVVAGEVVTGASILVFSTRNPSTITPLEPV